MIVYKYRSGRGTKDGNGKDIFERDIELLSQDKIYIPTVGQLNDPAEALVDDSIFTRQIAELEPFSLKELANLVKESYQTLYDTIQSSGIYSLSKEIENELMWAYYASGHSGYAIKFDTDILANSYGIGGGLEEIDINYSTKVPQFDISSVFSREKTLSYLIGTKSKAWEHEREHRLIFDKGGQCFKIDYRAIKGIVFGCRMPDDDIDYVMRSLSGRALEYYKVMLNDDSYKLSLQRLIDKYPTTKKYSPNDVAYDIEELLEGDKFIDGVGYKYRKFVEMALDQVSQEPFVIDIYQIIVSNDKVYPHIKVWANIKQDGVVRPVKSFEYDFIDGNLITT